MCCRGAVHRSQSGTLQGLPHIRVLDRWLRELVTQQGEALSQKGQSSSGSLLVHAVHWPGWPSLKKGGQIKVIAHAKAT